MRVVLLTTEALHHAHYVREVGKLCPWIRVYLETESKPAPFPARHPFEDERDQWERRQWFGDGPAAVGDFADVMRVPSMNEAVAMQALRADRPDVVLVFGTGRLRPPVLACCPEGFANLHGGDPEEYRGLDSHLWAIYHRDFEALVTTLHRVNPALDDGEIVLQGALDIRRGMTLPELRAVNTALCVDLTRGALAMFREMGRFIGRPQRRQGRYYSAMPAVLKEDCLRKFNQRVATLSE